MWLHSHLVFTGIVFTILAHLHSNMRSNTGNIDKKVEILMIGGRIIGLFFVHRIQSIYQMEINSFQEPGFS